MRSRFSSYDLRRLFYVIGNYVLLHKKRSAKEVHLAEKKLVVNDTAGARKYMIKNIFGNFVCNILTGCRVLISEMHFEEEVRR